MICPNKKYTLRGHYALFFLTIFPLLIHFSERMPVERRDDKSISSESLLELTELVLKNNIFEHNGEFFKQKQGTAIGTKMAPPYAILFMDGGTLMTSFLFGNTGKIAFSSSLITLTTAILYLDYFKRFNRFFGCQGYPSWGKIAN